LFGAFPPVSIPLSKSLFYKLFKEVKYARVFVRGKTYPAWYNICWHDPERTIEDEASIRWPYSKILD